MAASIAKVLLPRCGRSWIVFNCPSCVTHYQQLRFKGTKRFKAPPTAKEKERFVPKNVKLKAAEVEQQLSPKDLAEFLARTPHDDVWLHRYYPPASYTFSEALDNHRALASPEMQDNANNLTYIDLDLDMTTKKKTKFVSPIKGTVLLPHNFDDGVENRIVTITKNTEDQERALQLGSAFVGGLDIIKKIEKGDLALDEFDQVVLNVDLQVEAMLIKKFLKDRFPTKKKGNLGSDTDAMVKLFVNGRSFESVKVNDASAKLTMAVGRLSMSTEQLIENSKAVIDAVSAQKSANVGSTIIKKLRVACPPSIESFYVCDAAVWQPPTKHAVVQGDKAGPVEELDADDDDEDENEEKAAASVKS